MNVKAVEYFDAFARLPVAAQLRALAEQLTLGQARHLDIGLDAHSHERFEANQQVSASVLLSRAQGLARDGAELKQKESDDE